MRTAVLAALILAPSLVWVTKRSAAYHRPKCQYVGKYGWFEVTRERAEKLGKRACKVCKP